MSLEKILEVTFALGFVKEADVEEDCIDEVLLIIGLDDVDIMEEELIIIFDDGELIIEEVDA